LRSVGFLKPFQPAQALYSRTASEEELRQETLVVENTQRPELAQLRAHHTEKRMEEVLGSAHPLLLFIFN